MQHIGEKARKMRTAERRDRCIRRCLLIFLLVFVFFGILGQQEARSEQPRIAFMDFKVNNKDMDKEMGVAASELVQSTVVEKSQVFVVERSQFSALAKEHELQYSAMVDETTAIEIGKVAGAGYVVLGSLNTMGKMVFITARLVEVQQGLLIEAFEVPSLEGIDGLYYALKDLGSRIAQTLSQKGIAQLNLPPSPSPTPKPTATPVPTATPTPPPPTPTPTRGPQAPTPTRAPVSKNPTPISYTEAEKAFSRGIQAFNQGDKSGAVAEWKKAAAAGHLEAKAQLGESYYYGWGTPKNHGRAFPLLKEAARGGSTYAQALLHKIDPYKFPNYKKAYLSIYYPDGTPAPPEIKEPAYIPPVKASPTPSADPEKLYQMAKNYYYGRNGKSKDYTKAAELYIKAANLGHSKAQTTLGYMYERGLGLSRSSEKAVHWYRKAAQSGYDVAQSNLGYMYEKGRGVGQSYEKAVYWYRKAAEQGHSRGECNLAYMYEKGLGVPQDYAAAVSWYRRAASDGYARGQFSLGWMYEKGRGVSQSNEKAAYWYEKAANQNYASAQNNLGCFYEDGRGVPKNYAKALELFRKAAKQGNKYGMYNIGQMYEDGRGVPQSISNAISWYRKAADKGHSGAEKALKRLGQ